MTTKADIDRMDTLFDTVTYVDDEGNEVMTRAEAEADPDDDEPDEAQALTYRESLAVLLGGAGSGNFGHAGRPGEVGGSGEGSGAAKQYQVRFNNPDDPLFAVRVLGDVGVVDLVKSSFGDVPGDPLKVTVAAGELYEYGKVVGNSVRVEVLGDGDTKVQRTYTRDKDGTLTIKHDLIVVDESQQGAGVAKAIMAKSLDEAERLGATALHLDANINVGGYAWARMGFAAAAPGVMTNAAEESANTSMLYARGGAPKPTRQQRERIIDTIRSLYDDPQAPAKIASMWLGTRHVGKEILLGTKWKGTLDMKDAAAVARMRGYLKGEKPAPASLSDWAGFDLGGEGSGNFGHSGRPGEVGGSAPQDTKSKGIDFRPLTAEERASIDPYGVHHSLPDDRPLLIGTKKDGGRVVGVVGTISEQLRKDLFGDKSMVDVAGQMFEDLPGDLRLSMHTTKNEGGQEFVNIYASGENDLRIVRRFRRDEDGTLIVKHDEFVLPKEAQGKGIAKAVLADSMSVYRAIGVDRIETQANIDVGGYAWAKYGFTAKDPGTDATMIMHNVYDDLDDGKFTQEEVTQIHGVINANRNNPKLPWHIAGIVTKDGRPIGKEILRRNKWAAELRMDDKEAMDRFDHYVAGH